MLELHVSILDWCLTKPKVRSMPPSIQLGTYSCMFRPVIAATTFCAATSAWNIAARELRPDPSIFVTSPAAKMFGKFESEICSVGWTEMWPDGDMDEGLMELRIEEDGL
jgi:hypothetical protein